MSRNQLTPATKVGPELIGHTLPEDAAVQEQLREHQRLIIAEFGDGLPWSMEHYEAEIRGEMRRGCESFLRAGRYLVVAKECSTHGEWGWMLERLGIEPRQAQRMMEAARRMAGLPNASASTHLLAAAKSQAKLIELLSLPEDQFQQLAESGETNGLKRDVIEQMTVRELRAAIRDARADIDAKDARSADRERRIEHLEKELRKAKRQLDEAKPDETATELRRLAGLAAFEVRAKIIARGDDACSLRTRAEQLLTHGQEHGIDQGVFLAGLFAEVERDLAALRDELGIEATVAADGTPQWIKDAKAAGELP